MCAGPVRRWAIVEVIVALALIGSLSANDSGALDFREKYALSTDRAQTLSELIPGSEDYFYYHCLHAQQTGKLERARTLLTEWASRHPRGERHDRLDLRQTLLEYETRPEETLARLRLELAPSYGHARRTPDSTPQYPTRIDPEALLLDRWIDDALDSGADGLERFSDSGLLLLAERPLDATQNRELLTRLDSPDYPSLASRVVADLSTSRSAGFGSLPIHSALTLEQLEACAALRPVLLDDRDFVAALVRQLAPMASANVDRDPTATVESLDRLVGLSRRLGRSFTGFKAHVLHHRLDVARRAGLYPRALFDEYLRLPRPWAPVDEALRGGFPDVHGDDDALVRDFLLHFFATGESYEAFADRVDVEGLRELFAEAKIVSGEGDPARWFPLFTTPERVKELEARVDLDFAPTQPRFFGSDERVYVTLDLKNVPRLLVKIYPIHALNYYREHGTEIEPSIELDGLIAVHEKRYEFETPAWRRVRRQFELPELDAPGVYVVEFLGGGRRSRAVIHKGRLHHTVETTADGHRISVYDDTLQPAPDARLWIGGREFDANDRGEILVPFTTLGRERTAILCRGEGRSIQATLIPFTPGYEDYGLGCDFHVARESLIAGRTARVLVRPRLFCNGRRISIDRLTQPRLIIVANLEHGATTRQEIVDLQLSDTDLTVHEFRVPERLRYLEFTLTGDIAKHATGKLETLSDHRAYPINRAMDSDAPHTAFLSFTPSGVKLEVRGRTGELVAGCPVRINLWRRGFQVAREFRVQSDRDGRVHLGTLDDFSVIDRVGATVEGGGEWIDWTLESEPVVWPDRLHVLDEEPITPLRPSRP